MFRFCLALLVLAGACGDSGEPQLGEPYRGQSWMQVLGERSGALTPVDAAVVPEACSGELESGEAEGLIYATWAAENSEDEEFADLDTDEFQGWPDQAAAPTTPILAVFVDGQLRRQAGAGYARTLVIDDPGSLSELVSIDVCSTMFERGSCHVPTAEFPFEGCGSARASDSRFLINPVLSRLGDVWSLSYSINEGCDNNIRDSSHPTDIDLGRQTIDLDIGDLVDGQRRELLLSEITWASSYTSSTECEDLVDVEVCDCTWSLSEGTIDIGRASVLLDGSTLYLDIRGTGDDSSLHVWGGFPAGG